MNNIIVFCETDNGKLCDVSLELMTKARSLAQTLNCNLEALLIGYNVEGVDVYSSNKDVCDKVIKYLQEINNKLEGTPFKVAYRTRNEFLLYVVNNLPYKQEGESDDFVIQRALDEITSMKVLSRIEGDETKVSRTFLNSLEEVIQTALPEMSIENSVSLKKLTEMKKRLESGYTSFWS